MKPAAIFCAGIFFFPYLRFGGLRFTPFYGSGPELSAFLLLPANGVFLRRAALFFGLPGVSDEPWRDPPRSAFYGLRRIAAFFLFQNTLLFACRQKQKAERNISLS